MMAIVFLPVLVVLAPFVLGPQEAPAARRESAPRALLFQNGTIRLNDDRMTTAAALLSVDGRVEAVGPLAEVEGLPGAAGAERVDLRGGTAVPGLQDAHGHVVQYGESLGEVDLRGCASFDEVVERVRRRVAESQPGVWILGRGWDQNLWPGKSFPEHAKLSAVSPRNPVFLERIDGHAAIANRMALATAGLDRDQDGEPRVQGGRVLLDKESRPTGVLIDRAKELVSERMPKPAPSAIESWILAAQERLLPLGVTCVHDMGVSRAELDAYRRLRARGMLRLRIVAYLAGTEALTEDMIEGLPMPPDELDVLECPGVKLLADGALGSRGAALLADYSDAPGERGHMILDVRQLSSRIALCQAHGLQPAVHAIGDLANRTVLDVYETLLTVHPSASELRPRIEHAQVVSLKDWPRFPGLGIIPSMQPVHALSDMPWAIERLGRNRFRGAYAWRTLAPELGRLAFGSDFPVESPDPLAGLYAARSRGEHARTDDSILGADQRLDGNAALTGFTSGAAYACHQEDRRGRLLPGYATDLTVISVDPVSCDPEELRTARVTMTVINGTVEWRGP